MSSVEEKIEKFQSRISSLEVYIETNNKAIDELKTQLSLLSEKLSNSQGDLREAIFQFKGMIREFSELTAKTKEIDKEIVNLRQSISNVSLSMNNSIETEVAYQIEEYSNANNLILFIKNNFGKILLSLLLLGALVGFFVLIGKPEYILKVLSFVGIWR